MQHSLFEQCYFLLDKMFFNTPGNNITASSEGKSRYYTKKWALEQTVGRDIYTSAQHGVLSQPSIEVYYVRKSLLLIMSNWGSLIVATCSHHPPLGGRHMSLSSTSLATHANRIHSLPRHLKTNWAIHRLISRTPVTHPYGCVKYVFPAPNHEEKVWILTATTQRLVARYLALPKFRRPRTTTEIASAMARVIRRS